MKEMDHLSRPSGFQWLIQWLQRDKRAALSFVFLLTLLFVSLTAEWIAPHSPTEQHLSNTMAAPSKLNLLGTDDLGRDIFSRLLFGARAALYASCLAVSIAVCLGVPIGIWAGCWPLL